MINSVSSGLCLFNVLVRESYLDSNANSGIIRTQMSDLDTYLCKTRNNIVKFNDHIQTLIDTLTSRG